MVDGPNHLVYATVSIVGRENLEVWQDRKELMTATQRLHIPASEPQGVGTQRKGIGDTGKSNRTARK